MSTMYSWSDEDCQSEDKKRSGRVQVRERLCEQKALKRLGHVPDMIKEGMSKVVNEQEETGINTIGKPFTTRLCGLKKAHSAKIKCKHKNKRRVL